MPVASSPIVWTVVACCWLALALVGAWCDRSPPSPRPDLPTGLASWLINLYCRWFCGLRTTGLEHLRAAERALAQGRGIIITANHAAGIDPLLIQSAVRPTGGGGGGGGRGRGDGSGAGGSGGGGFYIRWVAAAETISPSLRSFVEFADVVFVSGAGGSGPAVAGHGHGGDARDGGPGPGGQGVRAVVRYLRGDPTHRLQRGRPGVIGLFPEGRIVRRAGCITPFQPGAGLMISRGDALVLPVVLRGVPVRNNTYSGFAVPSRCTVEFHEPIDYRGVKPAAIVADLQQRYQGWVGPVVPALGAQRK